MYTGTDVLIIVLLTILGTVLFTAVVISCAVISSTEKEKERAYRIGVEDGKKVGGKNDVFRTIGEKRL